MASNENGYLGGMMVSYPFRDIEPSTVNDCFGSSVLVAANVGYRAEKRVDEGRLGVRSRRCPHQPECPILNIRSPKLPVCSRPHCGHSRACYGVTASGATCSFWQMSRTAASPREVRDIRIAAASNGLMSPYLVLEQAIVLRSLVGTVLPLRQRGCKCRFVRMSILPG